MRTAFLLVSSALVSGLLLASTAQAQNAPASAADNRSAIARMEVRFSAMEERLRDMQGRIEQLEFENRRMGEQLDLFRKDTDIRFMELEQRGASPATAAPASANGSNASQPAPAINAAEKQVLKMPNRNSSQFSDPREHYNHAFGLLNKTQYDEAGQSFEAFIKAYPKDPLLGNAFYWAGETHYVRQNFVQAMDYFRQGYEAMPDGPKAGDNLLKLAMSLAALERGTEACVVLKQVTAKFGNDSTSLKKKAEMERSRLGCK